MRPSLQLCRQALLIALLSCSFIDAATITGVPGNADTVSVTESAAVGTVLYTLSATTSSTIAWAFQSGGVSVACNSGTTTLLNLQPSGTNNVKLIVGSGGLDYETNRYHICLISASDGTSTTATITVSVVNAWDVTPSPSTATKTGSVTEEQPIGTPVMDSTPVAMAFTFTDAEVAGSGDVLTCALSGTNSGLFAVTTAATGTGCTCTITTNVKIDRESLAADWINNILVTATDKGGLVGTGTMSVSVVDINDNAPTCPTLIFSATVTEAVSVGTIATIAGCTDADEGANAVLVYGFVGGTYTGFSIASNVVSLTAAQDYDTISTNPETLYVFIRDSATSTQLTITATVSVKITGINDNTPAFASLSPGTTATYPESTTLGSTLFTQSATDADKAGEPDSTLTWSIVQAQTTTPSGTNLISYFTIDSSGTVKLGTQAMDYETWQVCEIIVKVSDQGTNPGALSVTRTLTLSLTDVNEFAPTFSSSNYKVSLAENNVENYTVLNSFYATDPDKSNLPVWCDITSGNTGSVFRFNTTNRNVLELATTIEPDQPTNHPLIFLLQVVCKDNNGTSPSLTSTTTIEVDITTSNDYAPSISGSSSCTSTSRCSEGTTLSGSTVGTFSVSDNDVGNDGVVDCRITGPAGAPFVLQGCTTVLLSGSLDYETAQSYGLLIEARDRGSPSKSTTLTMSIYVGDVDDNAPYCTTYSYAFSVPENTAVGTSVGIINCRDADSAGVVYSLVPATVPFTVAVSGNTANLKIGTSPDYESVTSYTFVVRTTDLGTLGRTTDATVIVQITPVNEYTPTFSTTTISVAENIAPGTVVTTFAAVDADTGGQGVVSYAIQSATNGGTNFFSISNSGQVAVIKGLDYETTQQYQLTITATDGGGLVGTGTLTVAITDVNDNSPVCTNAEVSLTMPENAASNTAATGTQPVATDADSPVLYGKIAYSIASGNTGNYFSVGSSSGTISRSGTAGLDYEALTPPWSYYNLTIYAIDENGAGPNTATCLAVVTVLDVEEGPPVFGTTLASATGITETSPVGTLVYTPTYTHVDKWDIPVFTISPANTNFSIDSTNGKVYIAAALDYETTTQHVLILVATDKNGNKGSMTLTVPVGNVNEFSPVCSPSSTIVYIDENDQTTPSFPKNVMTFSCSDGDAGTTLLYSVTKVNGTAGSTGYDFISNILRTQAALNYETAINAILEIQISDQGPGTPNILTVTVTVSVNPVNEYTPVFTASTLTPSAVAENVAVGTSVAVLIATDADQGSNHATIKYALVSGNSKGFFTLNEASGTVTTAKSLDYEDAPSYLLTVSATDGPGLSTTATLTISLTDVNDNSPVFTQSTYSVSINENAATGSVLMSFSGKVSDADGTSTNNVVTLSLVTTGTPFQLVSNQLQLTTGGTLNAATSPSYTLVVRATDSAPAPFTLTTDTQVIVQVVAVNSAAPSFSGSSTVSTAENTAVGSLICIVNATDTDSGLNGVITYSIVSGNTNTDFTVISSTGYVRLNNALDYDFGTKVYYLGIEAKDSGSPAKSTTWTLTVSVTDVNDNAPIWWANNTYSISVSEGVSSVPTNIYQTLVSDPDTGAGGTVNYTVISQTGTAPDGVSSLFGVDVTSGAVRLLKQADREFMSTYYITIMACDAVTPALCSERLFTIYIQDVNDNSPNFGLCPKEVSVSEAATVGTIVSSITATDIDAGANGNINNYYLTSADGGLSSPAGFFAVSSAGVITTTGTLDRETKSVYQFYISADDSGAPPNTGSCLLNVTIGDVNDNAPVVSGTPIITSVSEAATGGTIFYTVVATDADLGINAALLFDIIAFTPANNFSINNKGQMSVFTSNMLDREINAAYNLTIRVRDQGTPVQSTTVTVSINIGDVNDNAPSFGATSVSRSVDENSAVNTSVGTVVGATDPDLGENASITYQISAILVPTSGGDYFSIDPLTGQIRVKVAALDRETRDTYLLRLIAMDNGSPALTGTTTVTITINDVNDNSPVFSSTYTSGVSVNENSAAGTSVTTFTATDADIGANALIVYSIDTSRLNGSLVNTYFQVDSSTGQLTVKTPIDRETYSVLQFYIMAQDSGTTPNTASASVNLYINDVNDNTPVFNPTFYNTEMYYKETRTSITLATLKATDADATGNTISYGWGSTSANFVVNTVSGAVTPAYGQATSKNSEYVQYPTAADSGSPQRTATATIRIDTFDPTEVAVCVTYTLTETNFLAYQSTIQSALTTTLQFKYPTNKCKTWKYTSSSTQVVACHYCVQDNTTDSVSNIAVSKAYVSQSDLLTFWRLDSAGTPTAMLQSSSFTNTPIVKVEGYTDSTSTTDTPWYQTPWGIAIIVLSSVLGASLIGVGIGALANYLANKSPSVPAMKSAPKSVPRANHPTPQAPKARPNENKNVYRDKNLWRGTPDFGRNFQNSPGEVQQTGHSPNATRTPTPIS